MDEQTKNLILATALSFLVLLTWMFLFPPAPIPENNGINENQTEQSIEGNNKKLSNEEISNLEKSTKKNSEDSFAPRIEILTKNLKGSIWLKGGRIDDLSLQKYRETLPSFSKCCFEK